MISTSHGQLDGQLQQDVAWWLNKHCLFLWWSPCWIRRERGMWWDGICLKRRNSFPFYQDYTLFIHLFSSRILNLHVDRHTLSLPTQPGWMWVMKCVLHCGSGTSNSGKVNKQEELTSSSKNPCQINRPTKYWTLRFNCIHLLFQWFEDLEDKSVAPKNIHCGLESL